MNRLCFIGHMRRTRWPWALLFSIVVIVIALLATSWNWVLVENSRSMLNEARDRWADQTWVEQSSPWLGIVLGSLGFGVLIFVFSIFFAKVLREMRLNQLQKDFLANITHELKTPLASLELSSSMLQNPENLTSSEQNKLWENHNIELLRLRDEIERLLTSSRWEQFQDKPQLQVFALEEWLYDTLTKWQRKLSTQTDFKKSGEKLDFNIEADPSLLNLIFNNILDNAIKFSGDTSPSITLKTEKSETTWAIHFCDQGIGFDEKESDQIFKRFKRLKHHQKRAIAGTGLGLHLAYSAANNMNMKLSAHSKGHNEGACFVLHGEILS